MCGLPAPGPLGDRTLPTRHNARVSSRLDYAPEARKEYEGALKIRRELAQKKTDIYVPDVADSLDRLGDLDSNQDRVEEARKEYTEALKIYENFAKDDPEDFSADVTRVRKQLAELPNP